MAKTEFTGNFAFNFNALGIYNPDWDLETRCMFDHLFFKCHKDANWSYPATYRQLGIYLSIKPKKCASILQGFEDYGWITRSFQKRKKSIIYMDVDKLQEEFTHFYYKTERGVKVEYHRVLNINHENYQKQRKFFLNLLPF